MSLLNRLTLAISIGPPGCRVFDRRETTKDRAARPKSYFWILHVGRQCWQAETMSRGPQVCLQLHTKVGRIFPPLQAALELGVRADAPLKRGGDAQAAAGSTDLIVLPEGLFSGMSSECQRKCTQRSAKMSSNLLKQQVNTQATRNPEDNRKQPTERFQQLQVSLGQINRRLPA